MRTINWTISTGLVGCKHSGSFEVEDDYSDDEIDLMVQDELWNRINYNWREAHDGTE